MLLPRTQSPYPRAPLLKLDRVGGSAGPVRHHMEKDFEGDDRARRRRPAIKN